MTEENRGPEDRAMILKRRVKVACQTCASRKVSCDNERPCARCVRNGIAATCCDVTRNPRRKRKNSRQQEGQLLSPLRERSLLEDFDSWLKDVFSNWHQRCGPKELRDLIIWNTGKWLEWIGEARVFLGPETASLICQDMKMIACSGAEEPEKMLISNLCSRFETLVISRTYTFSLDEELVLPRDFARHVYTVFGYENLFERVGYIMAQYSSTPDWNIESHLSCNQNLLKFFNVGSLGEFCNLMAGMKTGSSLQGHDNFPWNPFNVTIESEIVPFLFDLFECFASPLTNHLIVRNAHFRLEDCSNFECLIAFGIYSCSESRNCAWVGLLPNAQARLTAS